MYSNKKFIECVGNQNSYLLLRTTNNNTAQGYLCNRSTTSRNPAGMHLVEVDGDRAQSSPPCRMNQSERVPSRKSLTLAGTPSGMNISNGLPMLGNPTSTK